MPSHQRPLSPHLQIYRWQLTSVLSILHRISGILLALGTVVVVVWLAALAAGPESYGRVMGILSHPLSLAALAGWTLALFYHLLNGIRHLFWDAGWLLDLKGAYASGWAVVIFAFLLTAIVWGVSL